MTGLNFNLKPGDLPRLTRLFADLPGGWLRREDEIDPRPLVRLRDLDVPIPPDPLDYAEALRTVQDYFRDLSAVGITVPRMGLIFGGEQVIRTWLAEQRAGKDRYPQGRRRWRVQHEPPTNEGTHAFWLEEAGPVVLYGYPNVTETIKLPYEPWNELEDVINVDFPHLHESTAVIFLNLSAKTEGKTQMAEIATATPMHPATAKRWRTLRKRAQALAKP